MRSTQQGFVIPLVVVISVLVVGAGVFGYIRFQNKEIETSVQVSVEARLANAKNKLAIEKNQLETLKQTFQNERPLYGVVKNQYERAKKVVQKTDAFFNNPNSLNPQFKFKNINLGKKDINAKRKETNTIMGRWQEKLSIALADQVTGDTVSITKNDVLVIQSFVKDFTQVINTFTPSNSGLTQSQIETHENDLASVSQEISEIITSLSDPAPSPEISQPAVTIEDIEVQEALVAQAEAEVNVLEEELAQAQTSTTEETNEISQDEEPEEELPDLIIQSGEPELIQGSNRE